MKWFAYKFCPHASIVSGAFFLTTMFFEPGWFALASLVVCIPTSAVWVWVCRKEKRAYLP